VFVAVVDGGTAGILKCATQSTEITLESLFFKIASFNSALKSRRFTARQGARQSEELSMRVRFNRTLLLLLIGISAVTVTTGLMIANGQQTPVLIAGDRPVTEAQLREKLQTEGWSNIQIDQDGKYFRVTGYKYGKTVKLAVDSQTGRLRANSDDDDDDDD
jgi:hypothetical protein